MDFIEHLKKYLSEEEIALLLKKGEEKDTHAVLLNPRKMSDETFLSLFPHTRKHPLVPHAYLYDEEEYPLGKSIYHELGAFYIQEPASMIAATLLNAKEGDLVLDMCAAPGGKTIGSSFLMNNKGLIIANDIARNRAEAISENAERLGLANVIVTHNDFAKNYQNFLSTFDKIILDAPCSGSGMFRKDEKFILDWSSGKVEKFAAVQKELLSYAYQMLKPGGVISYSTCSYSYEEDEEVIASLLEKTDAELIELPDSPYFYHSGSRIGVHLFPSHFEGEGQYICQIRKPGSWVPTKFENKENEWNKKFPFLKDAYIQKFGDYLFGLSAYKKLAPLPTLTAGFRIGEVGKDFIKLDYALSHVLSFYPLREECTEKEVENYLMGECLASKTKEKGYVLLAFHGIPFSFGKSDGRIIKNHYPKGLRKKCWFK